MKRMWIMGVLGAGAALALLSGCEGGGSDTPANPTNIVWHTSRAAAFAAASNENKHVIFMLLGFDTSPAAQQMMNEISYANNPPVRDTLARHFVCWYANFNYYNDWQPYQIMISPTPDTAFIVVSNQAVLDVRNAAGWSWDTPTEAAALYSRLAAMTPYY